MYSGERVSREQIWHLEKIANAAPKTACRVMRNLLDVMLLDHKLNQMELKRKDDIQILLTSGQLFDQLREFEHNLPDILKHLSRVEPEYFIEQMLPWCLFVVENHSRSSLQTDHYAYDALSYNWYGDTFKIQLAFVRSVIDALSYLAEHNTQEWLAIALELERSDFATPHQLITHVYRRFPSKYAVQIFDYLTAERRRLDIGYSEEYDSRELIKSVTSYLKAKQLELLESEILNFQSAIPNSIHWKRMWLCSSGIEQYRLLHAISPEYLSKTGLKRYREWQRKFVDYEISERPTSASGG